MHKFIGLLTQHLAYRVYKMFYGISDQLHEKVDVHLSDRDNIWNAEAIKTITANVHITIKENQPFKITVENNNWNKQAVASDLQKNCDLETAASE